MQICSQMLCGYRYEWSQLGCCKKRSGREIARLAYTTVSLVVGTPKAIKILKFFSLFRQDISASILSESP